jgi:hypothetical protein
MKKSFCAMLFIQILSIGCHVQSRSTGLDASPFRSIHLTAGSHPTMVCGADVNNDHKMDVIAVNNDSKNLSVYLGDGKGNFAQANGSPFAAGNEPNDVGVADFNGDGSVDVAIANHGVKNLTILLGNGRGQFSFAPGSPFNVESKPHPHGVAVADFNGDKKPDLAVDSWEENKVLLLFGKGDGTFQTPGVKFDVGQMPYYRLRTADLNEDGNADIITSNFEAASGSILLGDGHGGFARKDFPAPPDPFGVAIADVNGDKHFDIAIVHYSGQGTDPSKNALSVLLGNGRGDFSPAKGSPFVTGNYPATVAAGDLNGDDIADIVIPNNIDGTLTVYLGGRNGITPATYSPLRVGRTPHGVAIADFNQDGKGDIVIAQEDDNEVLVLLSK